MANDDNDTGYEIHAYTSNGSDTEGKLFLVGKATIAHFMTAPMNDGGKNPGIGGEETGAGWVFNGNWMNQIGSGETRDLILLFADGEGQRQYTGWQLFSEDMCPSLKEQIWELIKSHECGEEH